MTSNGDTTLVIDTTVNSPVEKKYSLHHIHDIDYMRWVSSYTKSWLIIISHKHVPTYTYRTRDQ